MRIGGCMKMKVKKSLILGTLLTLGLSLLAGCNVEPFNPESNIEIAYIKVPGTTGTSSGASVAVNIRPGEVVQALSTYAITVYFRIWGPIARPSEEGGRVGATLTRYKLEYYKPDGTKVDYFIHNGQPVYLGRDVGMNLYVPPPYGATKAADDYSEMGKELYVVTQDVIDYADDTPDLHRLQVKMTFTGEDDNENSIELPPAYVDIEFQR
jgi:hypothetical protein